MFKSSSPARKRFRLIEPRINKVHVGLYKTYSQKISWLKKMLLLIALILFSLILLWPQVSDFLESSSSQMAIMPEISVENTLINPRMHSTDDKGRPFTIQAKSATQPQTEAAFLEAPQSSMMLEDEKKINITADKGFFDEKNKILNYQDHVKLESNQYVLETDAAQLYFNEQRAKGVHPVSGEGPLGRIRSQGFEVRKDEGTIHFTGKSKLILFNSSQNPSSTKEAPLKKE
jgi:LPS export ABC transporter protein LptC